MPDDSPPRDLRVLSYNLKSLRLDRAAAGRVVRAVDPDLAAVQEGPGRFRWRSPAARLAREAGLLWLGGGGPPAGRNLLLGRMRVDTLLTWSQRFPTALTAPVRGIAAGVFRVAGRPVGVAGVHLPLDPAERLRYVALLEVVLEQLRARAGAVVVAGDLNETPGQPVWERLEELGLTDAATTPVEPSSAPEPTFPARRSDRRLDTVWVSGAVEVVAAGVPGRRLRVPGVHADDLVVASDHLPFVADLRLTAPALDRDPGAADVAASG